MLNSYTGDEPSAKAGGTKPAATQTDQAETLAALDRLQQVGIRTVGELEVGADRGIEVARQLARQDDAVVRSQFRTRASCSRMALIVAL